MNILTLSHVKKSFGGHEVLRDVSFSVPEHSVFGFIGQNGAGKTTAMKIVLGLLKADGGEVRVNGRPVSCGKNATNRFIGYLPDVPEFYGFMTPWEYLSMCGEITGMPAGEIRSRSAELLKLVGLDSVEKTGMTAPAFRRMKGFSRGMKQRLGIAQALLNSPKLLICDEPTSALDPVGRKEILDVLCEVKEHTTVIFSTHILSDVERICDRIALLHGGQIALNGSLEEIRNVRKGDSIKIDFSSAQDMQEFQRRYGGGERTGDTRLLLVKKTEKDMQEVMRCLVNYGIGVQRLERLEPTLEDLFMEVAGAAGV